MTCESYSLDVSAIERYIKTVKDNSIRNQIWKKIEKVRKNPSTGETKSYSLKGIYAVKVNNQKIVILYKIDDDDPCKIVFIDIGAHDEVYKNTY